MRTYIALLLLTASCLAAPSYVPPWQGPASPQYTTNWLQRLNRLALDVTSASGNDGFGTYAGNANTALADGSIAPSKIAAGFVITSRAIIAGNGLSGGGALSGDVTLNVNAGGGLSISSDYLIVNTAIVTTDAELAAAVALRLALSGGTMSGPIAMGENKVTGLGEAEDPNDAVRLVQMQDYAGANFVSRTTPQEIAAAHTWNGVQTFVANQPRSASAARGVYIFTPDTQPTWKPTLFFDQGRGDYTYSARVELDGGGFYFRDPLDSSGYAPVYSKQTAVNSPANTLTTKQYVDALVWAVSNIPDGTFVFKGGDTMSGNLAVTGQYPTLTLGNNYTTKQPLISMKAEIGYVPHIVAEQEEVVFADLKFDYGVVRNVLSAANTGTFAACLPTAADHVTPRAYVDSATNAAVAAARTHTDAATNALHTLTNAAATMAQLQGATNAALMKSGGTLGKDAQLVWYTDSGPGMYVAQTLVTSHGMRWTQSDDNPGGQRDVRIGFDNLGGSGDLVITNVLGGGYYPIAIGAPIQPDHAATLGYLQGHPPKVLAGPVVVTNEDPAWGSTIIDGGSVTLSNYGGLGGKVVIFPYGPGEAYIAISGPGGGSPGAKLVIGDPTDPRHAATMAYVDATTNAPAVVIAKAYTDAATTGFVGDVTLAQVKALTNDVMSATLQKSGGTMTGSITFDLLSSLVISNLAGLGLGAGAFADGAASIAQGGDSVALGSTSHAQGEHARSPGQSSHAQGDYSDSVGYASHAQGERAQAIGVASHAQGDYSCAQGDFAYAQGLYAYAEGVNAVALNGTTNLIPDSITAKATRLEGKLDMGGNIITNVAAPTGPTMVGTKGYIDAHTTLPPILVTNIAGGLYYHATKVQENGLVVTNELNNSPALLTAQNGNAGWQLSGGPLDMGGNTITNMGAPTGPTMAVRKADVDAATNANLMAAKSYTDAVTNAVRQKSEWQALNIVPYRGYGGTPAMLSPLDIVSLIGPRRTPGGLRHLAWAAYYYDLPRPMGACTATISVNGALNGNAGAIQKYSNISAVYLTNNAPGTVHAAITTWAHTNAAGPLEYHTFTTTIVLPANALAISLRLDGETATPASQTGLVARVAVQYQY